MEIRCCDQFGASGIAIAAVVCWFVARQVLGALYSVLRLSCDAGGCRVRGNYALFFVFFSFSSRWTRRSLFRLLPRHASSLRRTLICVTLGLSFMRGSADAVLSPFYVPLRSRVELARFLCPVPATLEPMIGTPWASKPADVLPTTRGPEQVLLLLLLLLLLLFCFRPASSPWTRCCSAAKSLRRTSVGAWSTR